MANISTASTASKKALQNIEAVGRKISSGRPTPLDFDAFVPWICLQWQVPELVVVTRTYQVPEKSKKEERKTSSTRTKSAKSLKGNSEEPEPAKILETVAAPNASIQKNDSVEQSTPNENAVTLKAYYDTRQYLIEVAIINCPIKIHRKVIQAINLCVPFHAYLTRLVIRGHGVSTILLHEIGKLLPHSNLTYVCLDDSSVPEGNYYNLLEKTSQLKCLSLNRCNINDMVCQEIAARIDFDQPASYSLMVLELSTNLITDIGAKSLGHVLKTNRHLLHLNLTGNKVTDEGVKAILEHLKVFEISGVEVYRSNCRRYNYLEDRKLVLEKCTEEAVRRKLEELSLSSTQRRSKSTKSKKTQLFNNIEDQSISKLAENMTNEIMGEFQDPFCAEAIYKRRNKHFCTGNMILCSLNLSYNELEYSSIKMFADVLKYQSQIAKSGSATGLLRVVIEGNLIPKSCAEYKVIEMYLNKAINGKLPANLSSRKRSSSLSKKIFLC